MTIGQNIKKLRKNTNMTQEELAEMLSISPQAVSRWETNSAMPDITLLPSLCNVFHVSADELLGIDTAKQDQEINEIREKANAKSSRGYTEEAREIVEDGLRKFPKSYSLMRDMMYLAYDQSTDDSYTSEQRTRFKEESIRWGEKILASCTKDEVRHAAIQSLCFSYRDMGETEKAQALAKKMPHMAVSQQVLMPRITVGDKQLRAKQTEIHLCVQFLENGIRHMNTRMDNGEWRYTETEGSLLRDKSIALLHVLFEDGNFGFYHADLATIHADQAEYYAGLKSVEKTLYHLKKAAEHAIAFLEWDNGGEYTCLIFKGMPRGRFSTNTTCNSALSLLEVMKARKFEFLFDNEDYLHIEEILKPLASHWCV